MKTVQKQYKNSTKTSNQNLSTFRSLLRHLYLMAIPLLFLFVTSCNEQYAGDKVFENKTTQLRNEFCELNDCGNPTIIPITGEIYVINGCSISVNYIKEVCANSITIKHMSYTFANSSACNNYRQIWNQQFMNGQTQLANESMNQFFKLLSEMIEDRIRAGLPSNSTVSTLHFVETFCHTLCAKEIKFDDLPSYFELTQEKCGISCCIRSTEIKFIDGEWVEVKSVISVGGDCDPILVNCNGDIHVSAICDPACARL